MIFTTTEWPTQSAKYADLIAAVTGDNAGKTVHVQLIETQVAEGETAPTPELILAASTALRGSLSKVGRFEIKRDALTGYAYVRAATKAVKTGKKAAAAKTTSSKPANKTI